MQKNKIIFILAVGLLLFPLLKIQAKENEPNTENIKRVVNTITSKERERVSEIREKLMSETAIFKDKLEVRKAELEKKMSERKSEIKKKLEIKSQQKVKTLLDNIYNKLNNKINKLNQIDAKILAKIILLEKNEVDVTGIKSQYNISKSALEKARADLLASREVSASQITAETTRGSLRTLVKEAEDSIKSAANEYKKIIPLIAVINEKEVEKNNPEFIN